MKNQPSHAPSPRVGCCIHYPLPVYRLKLAAATLYGFINIWDPRAASAERKSHQAPRHSSYRTCGNIGHVRYPCNNTGAYRASCQRMAGDPTSCNEVEYKEITGGRGPSRTEGCSRCAVLLVMPCMEFEAYTLRACSRQGHQEVKWW